MANRHVPGTGLVHAIEYRHCLPFALAEAGAYTEIGCLR
jgi:hypothetical protein